MRDPTLHRRLGGTPGAEFDWSDGLALDHLEEWVSKSGVDPELTVLNCRTLVGDNSSPYVERSFPISEFLNWEVRLAAHRQERRLAPFDRGWSCNGIDCANGFGRMTWGTFKPDVPQFDPQKQRPRKYEHPRRTATRVLWLDVPWRLWKRIARRWKVSVTLAERRRGFWRWVLDHPELPIILVEGAKKAGALLSRSYIAVGLPGIYSGYRREEVEENIRHLTPDLQLFAQVGRKVYICFDYETKVETRRNVVLAATRTGLLFQQAGSEARIINLPGPEKGVDDFLVGRHDGDATFDALFETAETLERWESLQHWQLTYEPTLRVNRRYLGNVPFPRSGFAFVRSPKDTGKTTALQRLIEHALGYGRKVLVITNRITLGRAICAKLGLEWIDETRGSETARYLGFGLCVDSVHPLSQARFRPSDWSGAIVIGDEIEQTVWHGLASSTCREHRVSILQTLRALCQHLASSGGLFIGLDADLSDLSVDLILDYGTLSNGPRPAPWLLINDFVPEQGWKATLFETSSPAPLLEQAHEFLDRGEPIFFALDSQKCRSTWGSINVETALQTRYPHLRILRIDSETVADPTHPAYGCAENLNQLVQVYDVVIATPTITSGVSIEAAREGEQPYFGAVFGIFQGAVPPNEARQSLFRVRDYVPRYVWCRSFGVGKIGNGSQSWRKILSSQQKYLRTNLALLQEADLNLDERHDATALRTWAKMAARINAALWDYRQALREGLQGEGHHVEVVSERELRQQLADLDQALAVALEQGHESAGALAQQLQEVAAKVEHHREVAEALGSEMASVRTNNQAGEALAVEAAPQITDEEYHELSEKRTKTRLERHTEQRHFLQQRYGGVPVTADLKLKDDEGWYSRIRLHYFLGHPEHCLARDRREWIAHLERGGGKFFPYDLRLLTNQVAALQALGLPAISAAGSREVRFDDTDVAAIAERALRCRNDVKLHLGLTLNKQMGAIQILQCLLEKVGMRLSYVKREELPGVDARGKPRRRRVYRFDPPDDGRQAIFVAWLARDAAQAQEGTPGAGQSLADLAATLRPPPDINDPQTSQGGHPSPPIPRAGAG